MKRYRIVYEKREYREVWINADSEQRAKELFEEHYSKYDDESDEADVDLASMGVLVIAEIDEDGNDI